MLNWNWSQAFSQSLLTLTIISTLAGQGAQAQTGSNATTSIKVGETRSQSLVRGKNDAIARVHTHKLDGKNAATVYVRGIPVVTYIESEASSASSDAQKSSTNSLELEKSKNNSKVNAETKSASATIASQDSPETLLASSNPIERATAVAALINQFNRDGIDPTQIVPIWRDGKYLIKSGDHTMLKFDEQALFPASLKNQTEDVLESTNLLRRLLGGAAPIAEVIDAPKKQATVISPAFSKAVMSVISGMASWYGPGFDGNYSASGEVFNANDLTAAHPDLPFGTLVRVVNLDNGQSVVVRINDRGPYAHGRVIDISTAAANVIGLIASGVAPVRLEVLSQ
jgi:rare lipoprotein A